MGVVYGVLQCVSAVPAPLPLLYFGAAAVPPPLPAAPPGSRGAYAAPPPKFGGGTTTTPAGQRSGSVPPPSFQTPFTDSATSMPTGSNPWNGGATAGENPFRGGAADDGGDGIPPHFDAGRVV